jgi:hypothetical protein
MTNRSRRIKDRMTYNDYTPAGYVEDDSREIIRELTSMARERIAAKQDKRIAELYTTQRQTQPSEDHRTWSYYENLRKTDQRKYIDPKTQKQMFQDRMELGESFMDGSFDKNVGVT